MQARNRFIVFFKRIFSKKLYIFILLLLPTLTLIYKAIPNKQKTTDIRVAIYSEDTSNYYDLLMPKLTNASKLYLFYETTDKESLINDVKSGYAECGYFIPEHFFDNYIIGNDYDTKMELYNIPSTTLDSAISETLFSKIFDICEKDILSFAVNMPEYDDELYERYLAYTDGDSVFQLKDTKDKAFSYENIVYKVELPIAEIAIILIFFAGLLGLLNYMKDAESGIYITLNSNEKFIVKSINMIVALIPITLIGFICIVLTYGFSKQASYVLLLAPCVFVFNLLLNIFIRKSTLFEKVLPVLLLICSVIAFVSQLL